MDASITDPYLFSSYALPQKSLVMQNKKLQANARDYTHVYASHTSSAGSDGYVTIASHGDGVHVLDLSSQNPVLSHTLGPSTSFSCPPLLRCTIESGSKVFTTYAVISNSPDVSPEASNRTIWIWKQNQSESLGERAAQQKVSVEIPHSIAFLLSAEDTSSHVIMISPQGDVSVADARLNVLSTTPPGNAQRKLIKAFKFSRKSATFTPSRTTPTSSTILVLAEADEKSLIWRVLSIDEDANIINLGSPTTSVKQEDISAISCSASGFITILRRRSLWQAFQLESLDDTTVTLSSAAEPISLGFLSRLKPKHYAYEVSLLSLGSSHVLIAATNTAPNPEFVLLLWDLQYSILLASHTIPVPSTLAQSDDSAPKQFELVQATSTQVLLALTPNPASASPQIQSRSSILVIPFSVPSTSTVANAIGRAFSGDQWLQKNQGEVPNSSLSKHDPTKTKLLKAMRSAIEQKRPTAADAAFLEWQNKGSNNVQDGMLRPGERSSYNYEFVKEILDVVLQPSQLADIPYSSVVVRALLEKQVISANMVNGGLLAVLKMRNDWDSIASALENVPDVSETDIVSVLQFIVASHRSSSRAVESDAMDEDVALGSEDLPSLEAFLLQFISYPYTPATLRLAVRRQLREVEDVVFILEVLTRWIEKSQEHEQFLFKSLPQELPPLSAVLSFSQVLLDASFLSLLQHQPAHAILQRLASAIAPALQVTQDLERIRAPLDSFVQASQRRIQPSKNSEDKGRRRREEREQISLAVGAYRLEELVL